MRSGSKLLANIAAFVEVNWEKGNLSDDPVADSSRLGPFRPTTLTAVHSIEIGLQGKGNAGRDLCRALGDSSQNSPEGVDRRIELRDVRNDACTLYQKPRVN